MIERYRIAAERITVIPRAVDTADLQSGRDQRPSASPRCARVWGVLPQMRVVLVSPAASRPGTDR